MKICMKIDEAEHTRARATMIEHQLHRRGVRDKRVLAAMGSVPRHCFVPRHLQHEAYADGPLPIGENQTISQPYMVAITCQRAVLEGSERVLEVGAGSGYQAAVLSRLAAEVIAIERIPALAELARKNLTAANIDNVEIVCGDGTLGYGPGAPYDAIVVAAAAPELPPALVEQLATGGRIVIPVGTRFMQDLAVYTKNARGLQRSSGDPCVFVPLVGERGWPAD